jgi:hypothetical protein
MNKFESELIHFATIYKILRDYYKGHPQQINDINDFVNFKIISKDDMEFALNLYEKMKVCCPEMKYCDMMKFYGDIKMGDGCFIHHIIYYYLCSNGGDNRPLRTELKHITTYRFAYLCKNPSETNPAPYPPQSTK